MNDMEETKEKDDDFCSWPEDAMQTVEKRSRRLTRLVVKDKRRKEKGEMIERCREANINHAERRMESV